MATYLEAEPQRKKAAADALKTKLEKLEFQLGISQPSGSGSGGASSSKEDPPAKLAGNKHRFDDTEYLDQSRDINDNVKSAVAAGMLCFVLPVVNHQCMTNNMRYVL